MAHIDDPRLVDLLKSEGRKVLTMPESHFLSNSRRRGHIITFAVDGFDDKFRARVLSEHTVGIRTMNEGNDDRGEDVYRMKICDTEQVALVCVMWHGQGQVSAWILSEDDADSGLGV